MESYHQEYDLIVEIRNLNFDEFNWKEKFIEGFKPFHKDFVVENNKLLIIRSFDKKEEFASFTFYERGFVILSQNKAIKCPFILDAFGYCCFKFNDLSNFERPYFEYLFYGLISSGMGIIKINDLENKKEIYFESVKENVFYVDNLDTGILIGDYLLTQTTGNYLTYVINQLRFPFQQLGYDVHIYYGSKVELFQANYLIRLSDNKSNQLYSPYEDRIEWKQMNKEIKNNNSIFDLTKIWGFNWDIKTIELIEYSDVIKFNHYLR